MTEEAGGAGIYIRNGRTVVASDSFPGPQVGASILNGSFEVFDGICSELHLFQAVTRATVASEFLVAVPNFRVPFKPYLDLIAAFGVKSETQFMKGAVSLIARRTGIQYEFTPTRNHGRGFEPQSNDMISISDIEDIRIASALAAAIQRCG